MAYLNSQWSSSEIYLIVGSVQNSTLASNIEIRYFIDLGALYLHFYGAACRQNKLLSWTNFFIIIATPVSGHRSVIATSFKQKPLPSSKQPEICMKISFLCCECTITRTKKITLSPRDVLCNSSSPLTSRLPRQNVFLSVRTTVVSILHGTLYSVPVYYPPFLGCG